MKLFIFVLLGIFNSFQKGMACDVRSGEIFPAKLSFETASGKHFTAILESDIPSDYQFETYEFHRLILGPVIGAATCMLENTVLNGFTKKQVIAYKEKSFMSLHKDVEEKISREIDLKPHYNWKIYEGEFLDLNKIVGSFNFRHFPFSDFVCLNESKTKLNVDPNYSTSDILKSENIFYEAGVFLKSDFRHQGIVSALLDKMISFLPPTLANRPLQLFALTRADNMPTSNLFDKFKAYASCSFISKYRIPTGMESILPKFLADELSLIDGYYFFLRRNEMLSQN